MGEHSSLPFAERHVAKFNSGLAAARPATPDGVGDAYYSTDTNTLNLADTAGTAWEQFILSDLSGTFVPLDGSVAMTGSLLDIGQASLQSQELAGDPSTPASNHWKLYWKSGGLYVIDDAGAVTGPLAAGGGGGFTANCLITGVNSPATITDTNSSDISWDTEAVDSAAFWDSGVDRTLFDIGSNGGWYTISAWLEITISSGTPDGSIYFYCRESVNGTFSQIGQSVVIDNSQAGGIYNVCVSFQYQLADNDELIWNLVNETGATIIPNDGAATLTRQGA